MAQMKPHTIVSKKTTITTRSGVQKQSTNDDGMYINHTHKHVHIYTHMTRNTHMHICMHTYVAPCYNSYIILGKGVQ